MKKQVKLLAVLSSAALSCAVSAGGLDRSGHPYENIFDDGSHVSVSMAKVKPSGRDGTAVTGTEVKDVLRPFNMVVMGAKGEINNKVDCMLQYDHSPYGFDGDYKGQLAGVNGGPEMTTVDSQEFMALCSAAVVDDGEHKVKLLVGASHKEFDGTLTGQAEVAPGVVVPVATSLDSDADVAANVGIAFEKKSTKTRASAMYFGETKHDIEGTLGPNPVVSKAVMPRSIRLDVTSGLSKKHQLAGSAGLMRTKWSKVPNLALNVAAAPTVTAATLDLFPNDVTTYYVGLGKKLNDKVSIGGRYFWENESQPDTNRSAVDERKGLVLGAKVKMGPVDVSPRMTYIKLGAHDTGGPNTLPVSFEKSKAIGAGVDLKYNIK
ncbi:MAG: hypothetical protein AAGF06_01380 [Pseudomonadota bacterium]